jgi:hypothetical protein
LTIRLWGVKAKPGKEDEAVAFLKQRILGQKIFSEI